MRVNWAAIGAIATIIIPFIIYFWPRESIENIPAHNCPYGPCKGQDVKIIDSFVGDKTQNAGIDENSYFFPIGRSKRQLVGYDTMDLQKVREEAFQDAFKKMSKISLGVNAYWFQQMFEQGELEYEDLIRNSGALSNIVSIYSEKEIVNCELCVYSHEVRLFIPKNVEYILPPEFRGVLYKHVNRAAEISKLKDAKLRSGQSVRIDVSEIITMLIENKEFKSELSPILQKHENILKYYDDEMFYFLEKVSGNSEIENFPVGSYKINALSGIIIKSIGGELERVLKMNPGLKLSVITKGFTDPTAIRESSPISYSGAQGYWSDKNAILKLNDRTVEGVHDLGPMLKNNRMLSYARAYAGISYLDLTFNEEYVKRSRITFSYQGNGVSQSKSNYWEKRRIEFYIKSIQPVQ